MFSNRDFSLFESNQRTTPHQIVVKEIIGNAAERIHYFVTEPISFDPEKYSQVEIETLVKAQIIQHLGLAEQADTEVVGTYENKFYARDGIPDAIMAKLKAADNLLTSYGFVVTLPELELPVYRVQFITLDLFKTQDKPALFIDPWGLFKR
ncbi:MAG: hypothetical protein K2Y25_07505 [Pseudomonadaceae bacterium]|nr:hypothetical protein [Pseudomonadaceae bacterium]